MDRTKALEAQIEDLEGQLTELRAQLARAELDQWRGRIDDLEVQLHLGSLEARDQLAPLVEQLRSAWLDARERVSDGAATTSDVASTLRQGLENAMYEIRRAVLDAKSAATD